MEIAESGTIRLRTAIALGLGISRALKALRELIVRDTRAAVARGMTSLNRGKRGAIGGRWLSRGRSTHS